MKKLIQLSSFLLLFLYSCKNTENETVPASENDMDAARNFIRAALDGDYKKAKTFVVDDSTNKQSIDVYEWNYNNHLSPEDKKAYKSASIRFLKETRQLNDSVTIVHYSNSYMDKADSVKVIRAGGKWLIDLNFTFQKK